MLRLVVDGSPVELPTCEHHLWWLRWYAEEDSAIRLVAEVPVGRDRADSGGSISAQEIFGSPTGTHIGMTVTFQTDATMPLRSGTGSPGRVHEG